jgi:hypothetical protein
MTPCAAMGNLCDRKGRRTMGHCCSNCGKEMHIVGGGCCAQFELDKRIQVCAMCKYPAIKVEEDVETPASIPGKQPKLQLLMSHDMLLESDEEELEEEEKEFEESDVEEESNASLGFEGCKKTCSCCDGTRKSAPIATCPACCSCCCCCHCYYLKAQP